MSAEPALKHSDVVFMYAADEAAYRAYGATVVGWGGAHSPERVAFHHGLGIRCTGSMWCLTAGAENLHNDPALLAACAVDIEGRPVPVPWLFDHVYEGTRTYFGCTNHPTFREHTRQRVREAMAGGADGLHVDDHLGTANAAANFGGGFCDHCMAAFREYLRAHAGADELRRAGVRGLDGFDYRHLVRAFAATREAYLKIRQRIPLIDLFEAFHNAAAAKHVRSLGELAAEAAGHPVLLSANACLPDRQHTHVVEHLTHIVCEVPQHAADGTARLGEAIQAYRMASAMARPLAGTGHGWDWAYVKAHGLIELVRVWIALAYAHGQRFMVPHPSGQWCFTAEMGTHRYAAPVEAYAPVYQFIRRHAERFDGYEEADGASPDAGEGAIATLRVKAGAPAVVHLVNTDYEPHDGTRRRHGGRIRPAADVAVRVPAAAPENRPAQATLLSWDAEPQSVSCRRAEGAVEFAVPELRLWTVAVLE